MTTRTFTATHSFLFAILASILLSGCGLAQMVKDNTVSLAQSVFSRQIKTLRLDFIARSALNPTDQQAPLSTVIRVYQLKADATFKQSDYPALLAEDNLVLQNDLLAEHHFTLKPNGRYNLSVPLDKDTQFIGVVAFYRLLASTKNPPTQDAWRLVIPREELDVDDARIIELDTQQLLLKPQK